MWLRSELQPEKWCSGTVRSRPGGAHAPTPVLAPGGRRAIASAAFERVEVLGAREARVKVHTHAARRGFSVAVGEFELTGTYGRGERCCGPNKYVMLVEVE